VAFDDIGNMTGKVSTSATTPRRAIGQELNYTLDYAYYDGKSHQAERSGDIWYRYDPNGNVTEARQGGHSESNSTDGQVVAQGDVRWTSEGFGLDRGGQGGQEEKKVWARYYSWDEENRLKQSVEGELSVEYRYGSDGQRAVKYSKRGESLYFDAMWSESINGASIRQSKHVYVGQTRVSTRLNYKGHPDTGFEQANTYYYHGDHLGSAQLVTDPDGQEYEHIEYTPYGELWVEKTRDGIDAIPFRFTGKELDAETGLYYYGARYLDPKTSVWLSADPALGEYVPGAPTDEEARKRNGNLPGMGGVFNTVNLHLYHYAGNNPIKYTDPTGMYPIKGSTSEIITGNDRVATRSYMNPNAANEKYYREQKDLVGAAYVWSGNDPVTDGGVDCSGGVLFSLREMGFDLPDMNADEFTKKYTEVVSGEPMPGDVRVLYNKNDRVIHIQTLGNGERVNASGDETNTIENPGEIQLLEGQTPDSGEIRRIKFDELPRAE